MTVKMQKGGAKPIDVADESVAGFEEAGFSLCDGEVATEAVSEGGGGSELSPAERQTEIDAAGKVARDDAEAKGMTAEEVETAADDAQSEAADSIDAE